MSALKPCACGCGVLVRGIYKRGHWFKTPEGRESVRQRTIKNNTGRVLSEETKEKIRRRNAGKKLSPETCAKIAKANTGRKQSPGSIEKTRRANLGRKFSDETLSRMSTVQKKRALEKPETLQAAHDARKGQPVILNPEQKAKQIVAMRGRKYGPEARANMSKGQRARSARSKPWEWGGWKGGISNTPYPPGWDVIKTDIRKRDGGLCMICSLGDFSRTILKCADVHHISGDKQDCRPENLISLCRSCHMKAQNDLESSIPHLRSILFDKYGYTYD